MVDEPSNATTPGAQPADRYVTVDGLRIHYLDWARPEEEGKPPLILLHGIGRLARSFEPIAPHFREYDRMSTTVLSAYVGPKIKNYLSEFRERFAARKFRGGILVMGSNGGVMPPEGASEHAAATCLSGPAGGVLATVQVAQELGIRNAISFDMGGTSTDVSLIRNGKAPRRTDRCLPPASSKPTRCPL